MNKIISTQDRVFMAVVGPSGCGKTELIFKMLSGNTFYPKFHHVIFLYREMQQIYIKMEQKLGVIFKKYANLEFLNNLEIYLLIIDDSCEEIYNDKEFVKLATAGRHKKINILHKAQSLSAEQVVSYNRLEHITHHSVRISPRYSTSRIFRQAVESC